METIIRTDFIGFLNEGTEQGGFHNDDVVAIIMPLLEEVLTFHEQNKVAPLEGLKHILITNDLLDIDEKYILAPKTNNSKLEGILKPEGKAFNIVERTKQTTDVNLSSIKEESLSIQVNKEEPVTKPVYLPGYISFEHQIGHHDALTDIFVLGLILGSLSTGLDLNDEDDLRSFVSQRQSLVYLNAAIHPAIANIIKEMTELDRRKRARDLHELIEKLKNYRDYNPEKEIDLTSLDGFKTQDISTRNKWILSKLKSRLFDISRRNNLLHFKNSSRFLNLTVSSVPTTLNYNNIDPNSLFTWNDDISSKIKSGKQIALSKYLRIEDNPYIPPALDKIRSESTRDVNEYGFSQLRLVISSLSWYNLKEDKYEKITSPFLLVPVDLKKKKGLKDQYTLDITGNEAEVNPVLVYLMRELYDIRLPDSIVLEDLDMQQVYQSLSDQIKASNSGISIEYIDKPRIKLIHSLAKQTLSQFNRKLKRNKSLSHYHDMDYSYQRENFQPLGLKIYKEKIEPAASVIEFLVNEDVKLSHHHLTATEKERSLFSLMEEGEVNPYLWEFTTCNVILGNLNYKKMSLVRDFNEIIDENVHGKIFDQLFSDKPKDLAQNKEPGKENLKEKYHIISCDPTQSNAIKFAETGESYIIQGPPGTGKSQTITNLVADYIARGKRVLFVCEKRAAIDVVFFRLKQQKLDELCCRIHDSQADKKEFIMNLKETYNEFIKNSLNLPEIENERKKIIAVIEQELNALDRYNRVMVMATEHTGTSIVKLLERIVELKKPGTSISADREELIPFYNEWIRNGSIVSQLAKQLKELGHEPYFSAHPSSNIKEEALRQEHPLNYIKKICSDLEELFEQINNSLAAIAIPDQLKESFSGIKELLDDASGFKDFAENDNLYLFDTSNPSSKQFEGIVYEYGELKNKETASREKNKNWITRFAEDDLNAAREQLAQYESSFLSFIKPGFWKLKGSIRAAYDFSKHAVKPSLKQVLDNLAEEYAVLRQLSELEKKAAFSFGIKGIDGAWSKIQSARKERNKGTITFLSGKAGNETVLKLCGLSPKITAAKKLLDTLLEGYANKNILDVIEELEDIKLSLDDLPEIIQLLTELNGAGPDFQRFIKSEKYSPDEFEKLIAVKSLNSVYKSNKEFHKTQFSDIRFSVVRLKQALDKLYEINGEFIRARIRKKFVENINHSTKSVTGMSQPERDFKKAYTEGRKILENEFNKSMRYKSIRDLASRESGLVIQDLKPVWLMSPLSVSDTLPLNPELFDVVIFDEASQITIEEGSPPLFRAKQAIIVGDEMQMPPSNFFGSVAPDSEDDLGDTENENIRIDADSLLTQGSRKLKDVMLGWHYRSRYESLINFSNAAFYNRNLLTIPDQTIPPENLKDIVAASAEDAIPNTACLFDRSISYHHLSHGLYESRSNIPEADYIARLIRTLITKEHDYSIGVVAFSQEQQYEIESALMRLGTTDKNFENKLEEEYLRQENGQFTGLFVKNLENVQGDERDIIIMSVCYGYDHNKRMIMNFGPINRKGGEKRLNVIFSRAKQHMAVISSIKYSDIKNEYNEGANYFRKFLQYAETISRGDIQSAKISLDGLSKNNSTADIDKIQSAVVNDIASELNELGYEIDLNVGQSYFRCTIGIRDKKDQNKYALGILVDTEDHYRNNDLLEQYVMRPAVLKSFKWNVLQVFTKDWLHQPDKVIQQIIKALSPQQEEEEAPLVIEPTLPAPAQEPVPVPVENRQAITVDAAVEEPVNTGALTFKRLSFKDSSSDKFWEVAQDDTRMIVRFGKTGTKGQENVKTFESPEKTKAEIEKLIQQKMKKGYQN